MHQCSKWRISCSVIPNCHLFRLFLAIEKAMTKSNRPHLLFMNLQLIDRSSIPNNFPSLSNKYDVCEAAEKC